MNPVAVLLLIASLGACDGKRNSGAAPTAPADAVVTQVPIGTYLDFESGNLVTVEEGGDLGFDGSQNAQSPGQLTASPAPGGLTDVTVYPSDPNVWLGTVAAPDGTGLVARSDQGWAYAAYVADSAADGSRTIHWRKMAGVHRLVVELPDAGGTTKGYGDVTILPSGKTCAVARVGGTICAEPVPDGATVSVSAASKITDLGYADCKNYPISSTFDGWSDSAAAIPSWLLGCKDGKTCELTLAEDLTIRANFTKLVNIRIPDPVSDPKGDVTHDMPESALVACDGTHCLYSVAAGTEVTLTAVPAEGSAMGGWTCVDSQCGPSMACGTDGSSILVLAAARCPTATASTCAFVAGEALDARTATNAEWGGTEWMSATFN